MVGEAGDSSGAINGDLFFSRRILKLTKMVTTVSHVCFLDILRSSSPFAAANCDERSELCGN